MNPLSDLSLDDLRGLNDRLTGLVTAGFRLEQGGLAPRFDLTPGMPIRITLGAVMPSVDRPSFGEWVAAQPHSTEAASQPADAQADAAADLRQPEPVDAPLALGEVAEGAPVSAEQSAPQGAAESGGGQAVAAAHPPAAPAPGSASAMAAQAGQWAGAWTDAQDAVVVDAMATAQIAGTPKADALHLVASKLGRSFKAVEQRAYRIGGKIRAEAVRRATVQAQTETPEIPAATPSLGQGDAAVGGHSPAAVQSADPLTTHLRGMTDKGGWSLARDLELMELSCEGWQPNEIALQLTMQANAIKPRFDALTGLHDDPVTGKKARRWTREEVLGALLVMAGKVAA